jgi:hypothetical protein
VKLTTHLHLVSRSKNAWTYPPLPQYAFMAWCLFKHRDNFTFYIYHILPAIFCIHFLILPTLATFPAHGSLQDFVSLTIPDKEPGYGLDDREFDSRQGLGTFLLTTASRPALGPTKLPIQWVLGALPLGVKRPKHETDH